MRYEQAKPLVQKLMEITIMYHASELLRQKIYDALDEYLPDLEKERVELTDEKIMKIANEVFKDYKNWHHYQLDFARAILRKAQPEQEPVKISHKHEWFRTGEMKVGQMRCISCGTWGQEEIPQRTWVGLTNKEFAEILCDDRWQGRPELMMLQVQAKLKENNT